MPRYLEVDLAGVPVHALLREDVAPKTIDALLKVLPMSARAMHCTCSGECVWFDSERLPVVAPENSTVYLSQGDIVLGPSHEFVIAYGRRCAMRGFSGYHPCNVFAIVRDLDAMDRFAEVCRKIKMDGAKPITVRLRP